MKLQWSLLFFMLFWVWAKGQSTDNVSFSDSEILKVGYATAPPFVVREDTVLRGINVWLWKKVAKDLDLKFEFLPMDFSNMLDSLETGGIDLSINPLTITSERSKKMEFTHSFYASNSTIAVAETSSFDKLLEFIRAFFNLNFLKGLGVLLLIILLFGLAGWYFERRKNPDHFRSGLHGIWDGLWWSAVTLTTVGYGDKAPRTRMGKIVALILMFGGLLFISGLTASIASGLTVNHLTNDPDSFEEFKKRTVGSIKNTGTSEFLKSRFFKDLTEYSSVAEGLSALKNNEIEAFMYDEPILKYRIAKDSSMAHISILPVKFDIQFYAFGIAQERTELEQAISQRILEIMETEEWRIVLHEFKLNEL
ncbi:transporter substrate-binding domain-containing protein [Ulvibacterium sp.]|uniref:transporter substrate-binding domain-containing protein n=1 Tax=Ulvibacterium sp. TaxID=2665914 RepID=UPI00260C9DE4|nr:transporter substrate-binding domain-containing protein [Ulvibacterium sp.]